ncbi:alkaline-phosphatase-like protein, partial [Baffinella frigidus]
MARGEMLAVYAFMLFVGACGAGLLLNGFFPDAPLSSSQDGPGGSSTGLDPDLRQAPKARVIFMIIDAMRADFVYQQASRFAYINSKLSRGEVLAFTTRAQPPTVTLPRLKSMIAGSIPGFLDVAANLNAPEMREDNVISRAMSAGRSVLMFGDETWLRLFPTGFKRSDGTTAFFVLDTEEVDHNVTRHVLPELARDDWDLMVLHYLGLDHAGHLGGAHSSTMARKQREMDALVQLMQGTIEQDQQAGRRPTILVVASDHGMNDQGNHGGASDAEADATALFFHARSPGQHLPGTPFPSASQVDLAPTLALLLGVDVPSGSTGRVLPGTLAHLPLRERVQMLARNAAQLRTLLSSTRPNGWERLAEALRKAEQAAGTCPGSTNEESTNEEPTNEECAAVEAALDAALSAGAGGMSGDRGG